MNNPLLDQLMRVWREEATEDLDRLTSLLRKLRGAEKAELPALAHEAMRVAHTVKGASSSVGQDAIAGVAHALEDVMQTWRTAEEPIPEERLSVCEEAVSVMVSILDGSTETDGASVIAQLRSSLLGQSDPQAPALPPGGGLFEPEPPAAPQKEETSEDVDDARSGTMRVDVERLDAVMGHAGDLVAVRGELETLREASGDLFSQLLTLVHDRGLLEDQAWSKVLHELERVSLEEARTFARFTRTTAGLGDAVRAVRLVRLEG